MKPKGAEVKTGTRKSPAAHMEQEVSPPEKKKLQESSERKIHNRKKLERIPAVVKVNESDLKPVKHIRNIDESELDAAHAPGFIDHTGLETCCLTFVDIDDAALHTEKITIHEIDKTFLISCGFSTNTINDPALPAEEISVHFRRDTPVDSMNLIIDSINGQPESVNLRPGVI